MVTIDRHEWFAPPQVYTRDDSSGLWTFKPAIQLESQQLSTNINDISQNPASLSVPLSGDTTHFEYANQGNNAELADGITNMDTSHEHSAEDSHFHDESDVGTKKRRVSNLSTNGNATADCLLDVTREVNLEDKGETEGLREYQGANLAPAVNASFAESVIEPTLVMFEVKFKYLAF